MLKGKLFYDVNVGFELGSAKRAMLDYYLPISKYPSVIIADNASDTNVTLLDDFLSITVCGKNYSMFLYDVTSVEFDGKALTICYQHNLTEQTVTYSPSENLIDDINQLYCFIVQFIDLKHTVNDVYAAECASTRESYHIFDNVTFAIGAQLQSYFASLKHAKSIHQLIDKIASSSSLYFKDLSSNVLCWEYNGVVVEQDCFDNNLRNHNLSSAILIDAAVYVVGTSQFVKFAIAFPK